MLGELCRSDSGHREHRDEPSIWKTDVTDKQVNLRAASERVTESTKQQQDGGSKEHFWNFEICITIKDILKAFNVETAEWDGEKNSRHG